MSFIDLETGSHCITSLPSRGTPHDPSPEREYVFVDVLTTRPYVDCISGMARYPAVNIVLLLRLTVSPFLSAPLLVVTIIAPPAPLEP